METRFIMVKNNKSFNCTIVTYYFFSFPITTTWWWQVRRLQYFDLAKVYSTILHNIVPLMTIKI